MDCKERNYEQVIAIAYYNDGDITLTNGCKKFEIEENFAQANTKIPIPIPMRRDSGKLEETGKDTLQGTVYTVTLTWEISDSSQQVYTLLGKLKESYKHLIVTTFGENKQLIYANADGWQFTYEDSEGGIKCNLSVMDTVGIRRIL